jgi:hypothetical protein
MTRQILPEMWGGYRRMEIRAPELMEANEEKLKSLHGFF